MNECAINTRSLKLIKRINCIASFTQILTIACRMDRFLKGYVQGSTFQEIRSLKWSSPCLFLSNVSVPLFNVLLPSINHLFSINRRLGFMSLLAINPLELQPSSQAANIPQKCSTFEYFE